MLNLKQPRPHTVLGAVDAHRDLTSTEDDGRGSVAAVHSQESSSGLQDPAFTGRLAQARMPRLTSRALNLKAAQAGSVAVAMGGVVISPLEYARVMDFLSVEPLRTRHGVYAAHARQLHHHDHDEPPAVGGNLKDKARACQ